MMNIVFPLPRWLDRAAPVTPDRSARISQYWQTQKQSGLRIRAFALKNPRLSLRAAADHLLLPRLTAALGASPAAAMIAAALERAGSGVGLSLGSLGACILAIPANPGAYSSGSHKQTLRRRARAACKAGVTWRSVDDPAEQRALIAELHRVLPTKSRYRLEGMDFDHLVGIGLWTVGLGPDGEPLLVAVTPYDGEWALLKLFISLGTSQQHSDARYLLTQIVVERLSEMGVRYLCDTASPHELSVGLWQFQRMVGFETARVRVQRARSGAVRAPGRATRPAYGVPALRSE